MNTEAEIGIGLGAIVAVGVVGYMIYDHFANPPATNATAGANQDINAWLQLFYNSDLSEKQDPDRCKLVLNSPAAGDAARQLADAIGEKDTNWFENVTSHWGSAIHGFFVDGLLKGQGVSSAEEATQSQEEQALNTLKAAIVHEIKTCNQWNSGVQANNANAAFSDLLGIIEANWEAGKQPPYYTSADVAQAGTNYNLTSDTIQNLNAFANYVNTQWINRGAPVPEYKTPAFKQLSDNLLKLARQFNADTAGAQKQPNSGTYGDLRCYMIWINCQKLNASEAAKLQLAQAVSGLTGDARGATNLKIAEIRALFEFEVDAQDLINGWAAAGAPDSGIPYGEYTIFKCLFLPMGPCSTLSYNDWGDLTRRVLSFQANLGLATKSSVWKRFIGDKTMWDTNADVDGSGYWMPPVSYKTTYGVWDPNRKTPI